MEEKEPLLDQILHVVTKQFSRSFKRILFCAHPSGTPGHATCPATTFGHALLCAHKHFSTLGIDANDVVVSKIHADMVAERGLLDEIDDLWLHLSQEEREGAWFRAVEFWGTPVSSERRPILRTFRDMLFGLAKSLDRITSNSDMAFESFCLKTIHEQGYCAPNMHLQNSTTYYKVLLQTRGSPLQYFLEGSVMKEVKGPLLSVLCEDARQWFLGAQQILEWLIQWNFLRSHNSPSFAVNALILELMLNLAFTWLLFTLFPFMAAYIYFTQPIAAALQINDLSGGIRILCTISYITGVMQILLISYKQTTSFDYEEHMARLAMYIAAAGLSLPCCFCTYAGLLTYLTFAVPIWRNFPKPKRFRARSTYGDPGRSAKDRMIEMSRKLQRRVKGEKTPRGAEEEQDGRLLLDESEREADSLSSGARFVLQESGSEDSSTPTLRRSEEELSASASEEHQPTTSTSSRSEEVLVQSPGESADAGEAQRPTADCEVVVETSEDSGSYQSRDGAEDAEAVGQNPDDISEEVDTDDI